MTLCTCPEMPACEWDWCRFPADWSILQPPWGKLRGPRAKFMCDWHAETYQKAMSTPMKGIDRPKEADETWKPSIMEHINHARIDMKIEEQSRQNRNAAQRPGAGRHRPWENR